MYRCVRATCSMCVHSCVCVCAWWQLSPYEDVYACVSALGAPGTAAPAGSLVHLDHATCNLALHDLLEVFQHAFAAVCVCVRVCGSQQVSGRELWGCAGVELCLRAACGARLSALRS
jgi:hypothetical protein